MEKTFEPTLHFFSPEMLDDIDIKSDISWSDMINDIELGQPELKVLLGLGEECDLSMAEIMIMYLYYWENASQEEIANKIRISQPTVFRIIKKVKSKIYGPLLSRVNRSQ